MFSKKKHVSLLKSSMRNKTDKNYNYIGEITRAYYIEEGEKMKGN